MAMKTTRRLIQGGFLALTIVGVFVVGGNAERWCPFGGVEAIYSYATEGNMLCSLGVSNLYILAAVLIVTLLLRRAFCGYVCPIGTISDWLQIGARRCGIKPVRVPYRLDRALALLKYVLLVVILFITYRAAELLFRGFDPCYALLSRHGEDITYWAYVSAGAVVVGSLFVMIPFCRWLCPLAAVMHPFSRFGLTRIRRNEQTCLSCQKCSTVCPMNIRVAEVSEVNAARCLSCMRCIDVCPPRTGGALSWGPTKRSSRAWPNWVLVAVLLLSLSAAVVASYAWPLPSFVQARPVEVVEDMQTVELAVHELTCRGRGTLLWYFLDRDDEFAIDGPLRLEAWPGSQPARVRVHFDPGRSDADLIRAAITMPYYDAVGDRWRTSPFDIEGYEPFAF
jgi:ferredoxin